MILWLLAAAGLALAPLWALAVARSGPAPLLAAAAALVLAAPLYWALAGEVPALKDLDARYRQALSGQLQADGIDSLLQDSRRLAERCADCFRVHSLYADALLLWGSKSEAAAQYRSLRSDPDWAAEAGLALRHARSLYLWALELPAADAERDQVLREAAQVGAEALALDPISAEALGLLARLAETRGDYEAALDFLNRAFTAVGDSTAVEAVALIAEMGRIQKLRHPGDYQLVVEIPQPPAPLPPEPSLLLEARLLDGPRVPLARWRAAVQSWPLRVKLGTEQALLAGFDLAAAHRRGDRVQISARLDATSPTGAEAPLYVGSLVFETADTPSGQRVLLQLGELLP